MAKKSVLKCFYLLCSLPFYLIALFCYIINIANVRTYYQMCLNSANQNNRHFDDELLFCLQLAEDRRSQYHFGVDYIGIVRALLVTFQGSLQGASTIEQQFVRTVTQRYERTIKRKFIEHLVSLLVCIRLGKQCIADSYLSIAYFGTSTIGYDSLLGKLEPENLDINFYCGVVARLKYPQPRIISKQWQYKFTKRKNIIYSNYYLAKKIMVLDKKKFSILPR